jgi:predicted O-methyltransferase YrrM
MAIARLLKAPPSGFKHVHLMEMSVSLLAHCFNNLWAVALNLRPRVTHFLLWHSDILPAVDRWAEVLREQMEYHDVRVISAVSPIKSAAGMTSTARDRGQFDARRYSLAEILSGPETLTSRDIPDLLINTGLMLVDLREPWAEQVHFEINDRIVKEGDRWVAQTEPEDWNFSRQLARLGVPFAATRAVAVEHVGEHRYSSAEAWGFPTDDEYRATFKSRQFVQGVPAPDRPSDDFEFYNSIPGWFDPASASVLQQLALQAMQPGGRVVEIGSWAGRSTWVLAHVADRRDAFVLSVDHYPEPPPGQDYSPEDEPAEAKARFHALYDRYHPLVVAHHVPSVEAAPAIPPGLDLVFIDGDHSYAAVRQDIQTWQPLVRSGGILCGDDYDPIKKPGVVRAVDELLPARKIIGRIWYVTKGEALAAQAA